MRVTHFYERKTMGGLDKIIQQLQGATADLKADNDRAELRNSRVKSCTCSAYQFPHRVGGGKCSGHRRPDGLVSYHHTIQAMRDAGHSERDFA
jgi:hypothetical protein